MPTSSAGSDTRQYGFTLIEVLVVLGIMALVMALVVPAISKTRGGSLDDVARDVQSELRKARSGSVLAQQSRAVFIDVNGRGFWLESPAQRKTIPDSLTVSASVADSERRNGLAGIRFFPDGSSTGGFVRLSVGDSALRVEVDWLTGRVSINEGAH